MRLYRSLLRPLLFRADPEQMHGFAIRAAELASSSERLCAALATRNAPQSERLALVGAGLSLRTPLGLAARRSSRRVA